MAPSSLDASLRKTMGTHLNEFFCSLQSNTTSALNSFLGTLSTFSTTLKLQRENLHDDTLLAARNFVSLVDTVAAHVLELEDVTESIGQDVLSDLSKVLDEKLTISESQPTKSIKGVASHPAYIAPSYKWLLLNLHNPYPSKEMKRNISIQSQCSIKDVDAWFVDVRKRIGWNKLRKNKFSNKQEQIIAAATHFFRPKPSAFSDDPNALMSQIHPLDAYRADFASIERIANSLYSDRFPDLTTSSLNNSLLSVVPTVVSYDDSKRKNTTCHSSSSSQLIHDDAALFYPTPQPSPPSYSEVSSPSSPSVQTCQATSLKRRKSLVEESDIDSEELTNRPLKRPRSSNAVHLITSLPSPPDTALSEHASDRGLSTQLDMVSHSTPDLKRKRSFSDEETDRTPKRSEVFAETINTYQNSSLKRKRRLSDGENQNYPKRPNNALSQPRLQTVSDPFPLAKSSLGIFEPSVADTSFESELCQESLTEHLDVFSLATSPADVFNYHYNVSDLVSEEANAYVLSGDPSTLVFQGSNLLLDQSFNLDVNTTHNAFDIDVNVASMPDLFDLTSLPNPVISDQFSLVDESIRSLSDLRWSEYFSVNIRDRDIPCQATPPAFPNASSAAAKRAKIQALNEQIRQLEAEL